MRDLYELAYYLEGEIEPGADFYKRRDTADLREIYRLEAQKVSAPISAWQSLKALLNLAQTQIFNTDENRFKYDHTLRIEPLKGFFMKLRLAPEVFKRDRYFADNCIRRIRTQYRNFLNYELSAALYNKAAGLLKEPYESVSEPEENYYSVRCVNCGAQESYRTREEAERGECKICGEKYYVECPKCGRRVPAVAEHCPNCNFSFVELRRYGAYVEQATAMLELAERSAKYLEENLDAVIARIIEKVSAARSAKPESVELTKLEWRINKLSSEIKKRELIKWAESKLPSLSTAPDTAVSACMEILRRIKDYKPARDRLRLIKPKKPVRIVAMINRQSRILVSAKTSVTAANYNLISTVRWEPAADLGVVYTLVRKTGAVPANYSDGAIIAENTDRIEIEDSDIKPGVFYGYAVFAVRLGAISEPATCTAVHYSDLDEGKLAAKTEDGHCQFTWKLPSDNCLGVRILRSDREGNNVIVADCVQSPFVDRLVKNRKQYEYSLQCVYYSVTDEAAPVTGYWKSERGLKYSAGVKVKLTPELPPRVVKNLAFKVVENRVRFSWQNTGEYELWFKEVSAGRKVTAETGKLINIDRLDEELGSGLILKRAESSDEFCEFELTGDLMRVAILSVTPSFLLINEVITLANVEPCEIDDSKTQIVARDLKLFLKNLPKNIYMIHYKIR